MITNNLVSKPQRKNRRLGITFISVFTVSALFPIIASAVNKVNNASIVAGLFDVAIAILCFILFVVLSVTNAKHVNDKIISRTKKL